MPKIRQGRVQQNQPRIEAAARSLHQARFPWHQHPTNRGEGKGIDWRDLHYYAAEEALFVSLVHNHEARMKPLRDQMFNSIEEPFSKQDIRKLAAEIRSIVYDNADYWRLMYLDVIEFKKQHFVQSFRGVVEKARHRFGPLFSHAKRQKGWCGKAPAFVFASIYMYVFKY